MCIFCCYAYTSDQASSVTLFAFTKESSTAMALPAHVAGGRTDGRAQALKRARVPLRAPGQSCYAVPFDPESPKGLF